MAKRKIPLPLRRATDPTQFLAAINWCQGLGLPVVRCSDYQLKTGPWNFYTKGTFHRDDDPTQRGVGFPAFKRAIENWLQVEELMTAIKR